MSRLERLFALDIAFGDQRRRDLTRMVFRFMRAGAGSERLSSQLRSANAQLTNPLSYDELRELAIWCGRHRLEARNAR